VRVSTSTRSPVPVRSFAAFGVVAVVGVVGRASVGAAGAVVVRRGRAGRFGQPTFTRRSIPDGAVWARPECDLCGRAKIVLDAMRTHR
jgi:hypothetical protein